MPKAPKNKIASLEWSVIDRNAAKVESGFRKHLIQDASGRIIEYNLPAQAGSDGHGCKMPSDHALKFLRDDSFFVINAEGNKVERMMTSTDAGQGLKLAPHQVVASYHELSRASLLNRAKQKRGHEAVLRGNPTIDQLVTFLMTNDETPRQVVENADVQPGDPTDEDLVDDDDEGSEDGGPARLLKVGGVAADHGLG